MLKAAVAGVTALFVTASPLAYAQAPTPVGPAASSELAQLTEARIEIVKLALQLTPEQMKYWPAIEDAIRSRAQDRLARVSRTVETVGERRSEGAIDAMRNRDPVEFLNRRADVLAERSADLKKLADAWKPLYVTLTPEQKRRMTALAVFMARETRGMLQSEYDDE